MTTSDLTLAGLSQLISSILYSNRRTGLDVRLLKKLRLETRKTYWIVEHNTSDYNYATCQYKHRVYWTICKKEKDGRVVNMCGTYGGNYFFNDLDSAQKKLKELRDWQIRDYVEMHKYNRSYKLNC